jgi:hypothetical protein
MWLVDEIFRPVSGLVLLQSDLMICAAKGPFPSKDSGANRGSLKRPQGLPLRGQRWLVCFCQKTITNSSFPFHCAERST